MNHWENIVSTKRTGLDQEDTNPRTHFERDFDRLIFSSGFRRLQNKTQVFPLPGATFVHNRLTHSLEVASVGRSLGKLTGGKIAQLYKDELSPEMQNFYNYELSSVVAAACLAHDIGNPAFGHSGEKAIADFFIQNENTLINTKPLKSHFNQQQWKDLISFEGNANAIRILTHSFNGKSKGGMQLTYSTLSAILKYPCESMAAGKKEVKSQNKFGFFQSEKSTVQDIMHHLGMNQLSDNPLVFQRHPFVYLTEAADDICYNIIDLEDAQRLGILSAEKAESLLLNLLEEEKTDLNKIASVLKELKDKNERMAYLRAKSINSLTMKAVKVFTQYHTPILNGVFNNSLMGVVFESGSALKEIEHISVEKIYNHQSVVEIELAGYHVLSQLLQLFIPAILNHKKSEKEKKILRLLPQQYISNHENEPFDKAMSVLDFVSGMTDLFATDLYKKIFGIQTPIH